MELYEINEKIRELLDCVDAVGIGAVGDDGVVRDIKAELEGLMLGRVDKLEGMGLYIKNLGALIDAIKAEEKALAERRKAYEYKVDRIKDYIVDSIVEFGGVETAKIKMYNKKSESIEIVDESIIDEQYMRVKISKSPDKVLIKQKIVAGEVVEGAILVTNNNLQIK